MTSVNYRLRRADFNAPQYEAVLHREGPILVLAGAGSGKTRVIAHRIAAMIAEGLAPERVVAVSFTNKAAAEMRVRVADLVGPEAAKGAMLSTFHALGAEILRRDIQRLGWHLPYAILDTADQKSVLRDVLRDLHLQGSRIDVDKLLGVISKAKMALSSPASLPGMRFHPQRHTFEKLFHHYQASLKSLNAVDFDDLIGLPVLLFQQHPDVLERYQARWHYLLVDEYQDTNHPQFMLLKLLAGQRCNVMVVGDDDQSIYAFRGAVADHILSFAEHFPGAKVIALEQNYRSTQNILQAANAVISANSKRHPKVLWSEGDSGEKLRHYLCRDESEEATFVMDALSRMHRSQGLAFGDFAILYRTNPQSRAIEEQLQEAGLPYRVVGGTRFYDRREVRDFLHYLRVCLRPADDLALRRIVNTPPRGAGPAVIQSIDGHAKAHKLRFFEAIKQAVAQEGFLANKTQMRLRDFTTIIDRFHRRFAAATESMAQVARELVAELHLVEHLQSLGGKDDQARRRVDNLLEVVNALGQYERRHGRDLAGFLERVALDPAEKDEKNQSDDAIVLMTLHSAKGLEFPVVFMVGCEEGLLPHGNALDERGGLEEERRLCYVGITRAKRKLILTSCRTRQRHGETTDTKVSRFLADIPAEILERSTEAGSEAALALEDTQRQRDRAHLDALRRAIFS